MKQIILSILLTIFILTFSIIFTLNFRPLYYHDISALKIEENSGFSKKQILKNYNTLIDYNCILHRGPLKLTMPMSKEGRFHFQEVKQIFDFVQILCIGSAIGIFFLYKSTIKKISYRFLIISPVITFLISTGFALTLGMAGWEETFTMFHKILFQNDYWLFDEITDPVIKILPDAFFLHCAVIIFLCILAGIICSLLLYFHLKKTA